MKITDKFVLFYGGVFSQWYAHDIVIDGITYNCAEQYMMAMKAQTFNDTASLKKIMETDDPATQKSIGRHVQNFDAVVWDHVARDYVYEANLAKFSGDLKQYLLETGDREIVEASPTDKIWGIGLAVNHPDVTDRSKWLGTNWLGECIMQVRETLKNRK